MNRVAAVTYIVNQYGASTAPYLTLAGVTLADEGPVADIIDSALLRMGVASTDLSTASPDNTLGYRATLRYEALMWVWSNLNDLVRAGKIGAGQGVSTDLTEWRKELPAKIELARKDASAQGVELPSVTDADGGWAALDPTKGPVGFGLDYLQEPIYG